MVFSSTTFLILFLPVTLAAYYLIGKLLTRSTGVKNFILLIASLLFYAWGEPVYIALMLISISFNYIAGRHIDRLKSTGKKGRARAVFVFAILFNVAVLGFFKYFGFIAENVAALFKVGVDLPVLPLPIGISFYTFQIMSYVIDLYKGRIKVQKNVVSFALYVSLFPQLNAGPIIKYKDVERDLTSRKETVVLYAAGIARFTVGLAKKLLLANTLGAVYSAVQSQSAAGLTTLAAWTGIVCYTLQIYFDFSGYSDMAIGLGGMFGFRFAENFNYPYAAATVTDFWRRWHISLSSWFKEYVYIPLGGNRCGKPRAIFNLLVVWLLTGLWHGAAWNFVLWGLFFGILLILEKYVFRRLIAALPRFVTYVFTMLFVMLGWVLFSSGSVSEALDYVKAMFGAGSALTDANAKYLLFNNLPLIILGIFCALPIYRNLTRNTDSRLLNAAKVVAYPVLFALCVIFIVSETYNPFLYFRF